MLSQFVFLLENQQNQMQLFTKKKGFFSIQISIQISIQFNSIEYQFNSIHFLFLVDWDVWTFCWNKTLGLARRGRGVSGLASPLLVLLLLFFFFFFFFFFFVYSIYTVWIVITFSIIITWWWTFILLLFQFVLLLFLLLLLFNLYYYFLLYIYSNLAFSIRPLCSSSNTNSNPKRCQAGFNPWAGKA